MGKKEMGHKNTNRCIDDEFDSKEFNEYAKHNLYGYADGEEKVEKVVKKNWDMKHKKY